MPTQGSVRIQSYRSSLIELQNTRENPYIPFTNPGTHLKIPEEPDSYLTKSPYLRKNQEYLRKSLHTLECVLPVGQLSGTLCSETGSLRRIHEYEDEYRKLWRHMSSSAGDIPLLYSISAIFENANVSVLVGKNKYFSWAPKRTLKTQDFMSIRFHSLFSCLIVFKQSLIRCWRHPTKMCRISRIKE